MSKINAMEIYVFLQQIPKGKVVTYGVIASYLGNKCYARTVGNYLHKNPDGIKYPCYKVVNSAGKLSDHYVFGGLEGQKMRLEQDGVKVINNKVDLNLYGWIPKY